MASDLEHLLQEIAVAQDFVELAELEREATHLIEDLTARLTDAIRERREYLMARR